MNDGDGDHHHQMYAIQITRLTGSALIICYLLSMHTQLMSISTLYQHLTVWTHLTILNNGLYVLFVMSVADRESYQVLGIQVSSWNEPKKTMSTGLDDEKDTIIRAFIWYTFWTSRVAWCELVLISDGLVMTSFLQLHTAARFPSIIVSIHGDNHHQMG